MDDSTVNINTGTKAHMNPRHEFTGGTNSVFKFFGGNTNIGINLGYEYFILPEYSLQVGYNTDFSYEDNNGVSATNWTNIFNFRYNFQQLFDMGLMNAFFADAGIGFKLVNRPILGTDTNFAYEFGVGKRFQIGSNISYIPRIFLQKISGSSVTLGIQPIAVSIFFD